MKPLRKEDIKQEVFDLYDAYAHNKLERRDFVQRLSVYAVGGLTVPSLMSFLMPNYEDTFLVDKDNPDLDSSFITYNSPKGGGEIKALLSKPKSATGKLPGIVVVHENRGLNPYVEDTARRAALAGFITIAPDALSPLGGYPGNDDKGREMQRTRDRDKMLEDFIAAFDYLKANEHCTGKIGVVGFCFGGWISNMMAVRVPQLAAAVPFYGGQPTDGIAKINAPLMLQYAGLDERVNAGWPAYEEALKEHDKKYKVFFYPDVNHGFHNTSTPRYDKEAAELAWGRTIDFFKENLL
ncbi:dienelactone hydrolase family protein [Maribacter confluentis]|uniref:Carboxymethylenebutenolidase n=2 Tax=Maribacter TaxID=252356 RepID=A0ABY1SMR1_9FLAO|nr:MULTISPECIES: dienelactone hydrolase family protein [Maribacter]MDO1511907.1 dienelactone hydrolase family protein [Maribacter confluentis]TVZ15174.1 carboxymethylenebutenolidase [Maribacter sp. MAR_2009_72]SNR78883.1 carboxymethylenebutenolidase [Maribacter sedimenticola]